MGKRKIWFMVLVLGFGLILSDCWGQNRRGGSSKSGKSGSARSSQSGSNRNTGSASPGSSGARRSLA